MENNSSNNCTSCGSATPNPNCHYCRDNSFTKNVIEIDNPENLVLFHKVVIPASLGDETTNPPYPGKYCNVLMVYEANGHAYLYSSDGIPTAISFTGGGILVVSDFPEVEQATPDSLYIKSDTGDAVITHDNQTWITINEPGGKVRLVEEFPAIAEARAETLYILSKNGEARMLDTDGTWLTLAGGGGGTGSVHFNNIINRPKVDGVEMTSDTNIPLSQITSDINSLSSTLSSKLNKYVVTDLDADTNPSTTEVKLKASRENLWDEHRETKTIPLPVASHTQAGIMNTATFNAVEQNKINIEAIMNGAVAVNNLPDPATQQDITDAWKNATGQTDLINHASVYDVTNNKVWTYYSNTDTWYPASNSAQVNVNTFTNTTEGTILGSTNVGQVFAEADGTGSVNGWDDLKLAIENKQNKMIAGDAIKITGDTISADIYPADYFINDDSTAGSGGSFCLDKTMATNFKSLRVLGNLSQTGNPSPDSPIAPQVVTGEQTIVISDGTTTIGTYSLDLGDIELAKIGDAQDYIYKGSDGWYLHKEIRHVSVSIANMDNGETYPGWNTVAIMRADLGQGINTTINNLTAVVANTAPGNVDAFQLNTNNNNTRLFLPTPYWGSDHNQTYWQTNYPSLVVELYYKILKTPVDEKITQYELVKQLEAIDKALGGDEKTCVEVSSANNFPASITVEAFKKSLDGTISVLNKLQEEQIEQDSTLDYLDIQMQKYYYTNTSTDTKTYINYSIIPSYYKPKIVMSDKNNPDARKRASEFDYEYKPTLMVNLGPWSTSGDGYTYGPLVVNNRVEIGNNLSGGDDWTRTIMGISNDGTLESINGTTQPKDITSQYACRVWRTLYKDGQAATITDTEHEPRTFIAQNNEGEYLVGVCGGRKANDTGMLYNDVVDFINNTLSFEAKVIFGADGGRSSNILWHGIRQNELVEKEDRTCPNWLVWSSETAGGKAVFKNQSISNLSMIDENVRNRGRIISRDEIVATMGPIPEIQVNAQSRIMEVSPQSLIYNLDIKVISSTNIPAYTNIFTNLPRTNGNYYFLGMKEKFSEFTPTPFVLYRETETYSTLRSQVELEAGKEYSANIAVWCDEQY